MKCINSIVVLIALAALAGLVGCGYRFSVPNSRLPQNIRRVHVVPFDNRTAEPLIDQLATKALRDLLASTDRLGASDSNAVLEGKVLSVSAGPLMASRGLGQYPVYRMSMVVQLVLRKGDRLVWQSTMSGTEDFPSGPDVLLTEANRSAALMRLSEAVMRDAVIDLASAE